MAITYPVDVENTRWAILQKSTNQLIDRRRRWPVADGSAIPGLDPDFVYLLESEDAQPDYDSRLFNLVGQDAINEEENTITRGWTVLPRPTSERLVACANREAQETQRQLKIEEELIQTRLVINSIIAAIDGENLPPRLRRRLDRYKVKGVRLENNRARRRALEAEVEAGQDPDLDSGWEADTT